MKGYRGVDLDLDELEGTDDPSVIVNQLGSLVEADSALKIQPARQWVENFYYYCGLRDLASYVGNATITGQSILASINSLNSASRLSNKRKIAKMFKAIQMQASEATRQRTTIKVWAEDDVEDAIKKAKLSNLILDYSWEADREYDILYEAVLMALMMPTIMRKDVLDYGFDRSRLWPRMLPQMNFDGTPLIDPSTGSPVMEAERDSAGQLVLEQHPWNRPELISTFRMLVSPMSSWMQDLNFIGDITCKRIGWIRQNYDRDEEGYHPENLAELRKGNWRFTSAMGMELSLKQMTFGNFRTFQNSGIVSTGPNADYCTQINFFIEPSPRYPKGREIVVANGLLLYDGESRYYRMFPLKWHPYSPLTYERVPGRMWGTTYAEKLTDMQKAYEQARSEMDRTRRVYATPKIAVAAGNKVDRDTITGEEQVFRYNPYGPDGGMPKYLTPPAMSPVMLDDVKLTAQEFTEVSGMTEIRLGIRPQGVTTYRGLEVLREEANNSSNNLIRMYERFVQDSQGNKLDNIKKSLTYPDMQLVKSILVFKRMSSTITDFDIKAFTGEDLAGHVVIEPYSSVGKSKLAQQEKYMSLAQLGVLGDIVNDPDLNSEFKRKMDVSGFDAPMNKQVTLARWENQQMMKSDETGKPIVPNVYDYHDDTIHIREIDMLLLDPATQTKPLSMEALMAHRAMHQQQQAQKMMAQMQQQFESGVMFPDGESEGAGQKPDQAGKIGAPKVNSGQGDSGVMFGGETGFSQNGGPETY